MAIKLMLLDLDGTLFDKEERVSPENIAAIQQAKANGMKIAICSGRVLSDCQTAIDALDGCCDYAVNCNGSTVYDLTASRYIFKQVMPWDLVEKACHVLNATHAFYHAYVDNGVACAAGVKEKLVETGLHSHHIAYYMANQIVLECFPEDLDQYDVFKFYLPNPDVEMLADTRAKILDTPGITTAYSGTTSLEVFPEGMDKRYGVEQLLNHLGITFDNVISMGDSENDLLLLQASKIGVAMGNSPDFIKQAADFVSKPCWESGVAHAIHELLLQNLSA